MSENKPPANTPDAKKPNTPPQPNNRKVGKGQTLVKARRPIMEGDVFIDKGKEGLVPTKRLGALGDQVTPVKKSADSD